jgi:hypothetical protein
MSNPIDAGCSEMVSDDIAMDGESSTIDSDIHHREWDPSLRILPISPTDHRSVRPRRAVLRGSVESEQETIKQCCQAQVV